MWPMSVMQHIDVSSLLFIAISEEDSFLATRKEGNDKSENDEEGEGGGKQMVILMRIAKMMMRKR